MYSLKLTWLLSKSVLAFTAHFIFFASALRIKAGLSKLSETDVGVGLEVVDINVDIGMARVEHGVEMATESFWAVVGPFLNNNNNNNNASLYSAMSQTRSSSTWRTEDAPIKTPLGGSPGLSKVSSF